MQTLAGGSHAQTLFRNLKPGRGAAISLKSKLGTQVRIVLLSEADSLSLSKRIVGGRAVAVFETPPKPTISKVAVEMTQAAGLAREIPLINKIPTAPSDEDFKSAAIWKIKLPTDLDLKKNPILRIRYVGDVARVTLNGRCIDDNFYSGREFELGLKRYAPEILTGDLRLEILPLRKDSPIFLEAKARPDFGANETVLKLESMDVLSTPNH